MNAEAGHLEAQIRQLREVIDSLENENRGELTLSRQTLWNLALQKKDESVPLHPRLREMTHGHVNLDALRRGLKRLENDLADLKRDSHELADPPKHDIERQDDQEPFGDDVSEPETEPSDEGEVRGKHQRPLSAYINVDDAEVETTSLDDRDAIRSNSPDDQ